MCRVLAYLGDPLLIENILYASDNSFIKQSYNPKYMSHLLNLAGFGFVAWDPQLINPQLPLIYKTITLPFYDSNLRNFSHKLAPSCFLVHLRGVPYHDKHSVSLQNVHPFKFKNSSIAMAHNGALADFDLIKFSLLPYIKPEFHSNIMGTTDSEWIYAVLLSQIPDTFDGHDLTVVSRAIYDTFSILADVRQKYGIQINSPVNLFLTNGEFIAATRFVFDYGWQSEELGHAGYHSLWYTYGDCYERINGVFQMLNGTCSSLIVASEPLTEDATSWVELPEYTLIMAVKEQETVRIVTKDLLL